MNGMVTKELISYIGEDGVFDSSRYLSDHIMSDQLIRDLNRLESLGYLTLDHGDDRIVEIGITDKLIALSRAGQ